MLVVRFSAYDPYRTSERRFHCSARCCPAARIFTYKVDWL